MGLICQGMGTLCQSMGSATPLKIFYLSIELYFGDRFIYINIETIFFHLNTCCGCLVI
jgi:hypothetical protein